MFIPSISRLTVVHILHANFYILTVQYSETTNATTVRISLNLVIETTQNPNVSNNDMVQIEQADAIAQVKAPHTLEVASFFNPKLSVICFLQITIDKLIPKTTISDLSGNFKLQSICLCNVLKRMSDIRKVLLMLLKSL